MVEDIVREIAVSDVVVVRVVVVEGATYEATGAKRHHGEGRREARSEEDGDTDEEIVEKRLMSK